MDMQCAPTGQAKSKAVLPARGGGLKHCKEACALRLLATSFITGPAQQHVDMDWTWDARPGDGSQNSVQVAGGRYRVRPVVDRVNHARPHRRTRGLRDSMVLEGKADLQLPPGRAPSGRAALLGALRRERHLSLHVTVSSLRTKARRAESAAYPSAAASAGLILVNG